ncbi:hypothetical protein F5Y05DRAFT_388390 [Hypoxylon sp. FL0543]|nr:hypothetical protein F5Y05DRAFT_388390 [Hypoxylon sp. FL0543]
MESPSKKLKLGRAPYDDDDDDDETNLDELSMSPTQFDARQDPLYQLDKGRAKAATRLKSAFERIFEKYERDFTGVGDEIDLETGEVVINNGHLQSLEDEKDRAREGSISSDEEERIMRGKDLTPTKDSHSKSPIRANSTSYHPLQGSLTAQNQPGLINGGYHQSAPFGMQPNVPGFPNPYMFGPSIFNDGPVDPLWRAPEVPIPLYRDRFGFIGQPGGYPPSYGYGHGSMLPPWGSFGNGSLSGPLHPQAPRKPHSTKYSGRKLLPRASPAAEDSDEDDVLLGDSTPEVAKSTTTRSDKPTPLAPTAGNAMAAAQTDEKQASTAAIKKMPQKQRQPNRPKKPTAPPKPPEFSSEATERRDEDIDTALNTPAAETLSESRSSSASTSIPPPQQPREEGSILEKQIAAKSAQAQALARKSAESLDDQNRRSSRARKQTEFYSQITWLKSRRPRPGPVDTTHAAESATNKAADSSPLGANGPARVVTPEGSPLEDIRRPEPSETFLQEDIEGPPKEIGGTPSDQGNDQDQSPMNQEHTDEDKKLNESNSQGHRSPAEDSAQPNPLCVNSKFNTKDMEIPPGDNEMILHGLPADSPGEKELLYTPQDSDQNAYSSHEAIAKIDLDNSTEDMNIALDVKITVRDHAGNEIRGSSKEIRQCILVPDDSEETQIPPVQAELEEVVPRLPDAAQEETQILEPETVETELQLDDAASRPNPTEEILESPSVPGEDEAVSPPAELPAVLTVGNERVPAERTELVMRPGRPRSPSISAGEPTERTNGAKSSSPAEGLRPQPAKVTANTPVPRTPKKPRESRAEPESRSSTRRGTSTKKKFLLTSLVPDDPNEDDDELSILSPSVATRPFYRVGQTSSSTNMHSSPVSTPRKTGRRRSSLVGGSISTPHRISKRTAPPATDSRAFGSTKRRFGGTSSAVQSSPLARSMTHMDHGNMLTATPSKRRGMGAGAHPESMSSSPIRTPGGSTRRCGEDGFVCERDFCFTCCK